MKDAKYRFESIMCLISEGREFLTNTELIDAIEREVKKGFATFKESEKVKCCAFCSKFETSDCSIVQADNWSKWKDYCSKFEWGTVEL